MSTITAPRPYRPGTPDDPYYYGFRDICTQQPDGSKTFERFPLTLEDCLHPQFGDMILESPLHDLVCDYLADVCRARLADDEHALVLSNAGVFWDDPDLGHHAPDVAVIFGVKNRGAKRESFNVAAEGTRPTLIIEVVSPNTRTNDVDRKFEQYHQARVPMYVIVDRGGDKWDLFGYRYTLTEYHPMSTDDRGRLWLEPIGLWLGLKGNGVALYDGKADAEIGDYTTVTKERDAASARAKIEAERAKVEAERANIEAAARAAAEKRIRELEELVKSKNA